MAERRVGLHQSASRGVVCRMLQIPSHIESLIPYQPGKPIEETKREYKLKRVVKLASNENPLGPSPKALQAITGARKELHRYPDSSAHHLKLALAKKHQVAPSGIILGNGSNDVIDVLIRSFTQPGDSIATSQAAFVAYKVCAHVAGIECFETELRADLTFDLEKLARLVNANPRIKLAFIANPNNPTGTYNTSEELRAFLKSVEKQRGDSVLVVIDAAYQEYVTAKDLPDPHALACEFSNVVVLRTFSKVYGLAGLRIGYGVAHPSIVAILDKVRQPFNINSLGLVAAEAALNDDAFVKKAVKSNQQGMKFWEKTLGAWKVPFWKSQGNFILFDAAQGFGMRGVELNLECLKRGVILRPVANYGLHHALRLSIGTAVENQFAARVLKEFRKK